VKLALRGLALNAFFGANIGLVLTDFGLYKLRWAHDGTLESTVRYLLALDKVHNNKF
jgi:hypothetical protein